MPSPSAEDTELGGSVCSAHAHEMPWPRQLKLEKKKETHKKLKMNAF